LKVCITKITEIVGKDGREWTKVDFVGEDGETGTSMFKKGDHEVSLDSFEATYGTNVEFNARGRLVGIEE